MAKKPVEMIRCRYVFEFLVEGIALVSFTKCLDLCQSILVFLTVTYDKIFDQPLESSSSLGLQLFSFFISLILK